MYLCPPQLKNYSDKKITLPKLIFSPILSNLHAKAPLGNSLLGHRFPQSEDLFYSYSFPTGCSHVMLGFVWYLHSFTVSPLAFKVMGWFLNWKQMNRWQDSNLCIYLKKDSLCLLLMLSNPHMGKKLPLHLQGIKIIEWSSSAQHGAVFCEGEKNVAAVCFQRGRQHPGWDLWQGWGPPGPWVQRGLGMDPGFQTWRCLRMRSWLREADQAIGNWYMMNEYFTIWLCLEVWPFPLPTLQRRAGVQWWYILDL